MKAKNLILTALAIIGLAFLTPPVVHAQTCDGNGSNFVDLDGDGFNDNAPDHDGDGIPNGLDEDYVPNPQDGSGYRNGKATDKIAGESTQKRTMTQTKTFNGDMFRKRIGAQGEQKGTGTGICDGTGPHGLKRGGRK
jgi:hypothetical protein